MRGGPAKFTSGQHGAGAARPLVALLVNVVWYSDILLDQKRVLDAVRAQSCLGQGRNRLGLSVSGQVAVYRFWLEDLLNLDLHHDDLLQFRVGFRLLSDEGGTRRIGDLLNSRACADLLLTLDVDLVGEER